jgi:cytochrome c biogenesis protein CcmG/thiol:disulfide interchange protein DsbE
MRAWCYALAVALLAATACTDAKPKASPTETVPMIATDACPSAGALLATPASDGKRLPDVDLPCIGHDGRVNLRALGGMPYVVNLWGSWCFPCRTEMPEFQKVYAAYKGRVGFLGVDTKDFDKPARAAIQRAAISYPSVFDPDEKVKRSLNARSLPTTVLVGADGRIKDVHVGELTEAELRAAITKHLGVS